MVHAGECRVDIGRRLMPLPWRECRGHSHCARTAAPFLISGHGLEVLAANTRGWSSAGTASAARTRLMTRFVSMFVSSLVVVPVGHEEAWPGLAGSKSVDTRSGAAGN